MHRSPPSTASARRPDPRRARVRRSRTVSFPVLLTRYHSDEPLSRPPPTQAVRRAGAPPVRDHRERREKKSHLEANPRRFSFSSTRRFSRPLAVRVRPRLARPSPPSRRRVPRSVAWRYSSRAFSPFDVTFSHSLVPTVSPGEIVATRSRLRGVSHPGSVPRKSTTRGELASRGGGDEDSVHASRSHGAA